MLAKVPSFPLFTYLDQVRDELQKVSWPTKQQTIEKTTLVVTVSVLVGTFIGALDYLFTQLMALVLK